MIRISILAAAICLAQGVSAAQCSPLLAHRVDNIVGHQEPGSNQEIAEFCDRTYAVKFPMFAKYLIARDGMKVASFGSEVEPESKEFIVRLEEYLAASPR